MSEQPGASEPAVVLAQAQTPKMANPYNRMMVRDAGLIVLACILVLGTIILIGVGRIIPGELWGIIGSVIGAVVGTMGRYNGHDSGRTVPIRVG